MCRLKAALRRLDVRDADDFDEVEYRAASEAVRQQTQSIVRVSLLSTANTSCASFSAAAYMYSIAHAHMVLLSHSRVMLLCSCDRWRASATASQH